MTPDRMTPPLPVVIIATCFYVWMFVDAVRRRVPFYWYLIILFVPFGAFIYFGLIKLPELMGRKPALGAGPAPGPTPLSTGQSLEEIAERASQTPSELNKLAFADKLAESRRLPEAVGRYRDVLRQNKDSKEALHGLARALLSMGRPDEAVEELATLMELDPEYRDYSAALDYAEALWQAGKQDDTIGLLTGLVSVSKRINHRMALAHYLKERGDSATARQELDEALRDFASSPDFVQRRDQRWADRARKLLAELN